MDAPFEETQRCADDGDAESRTGAAARTAVDVPSCPFIREVFDLGTLATQIENFRGRCARGAPT
ncbi:MAG: hypothetical protein AMXMBFR72_36140 [Betaproteobacteria bacterium]